MTPPAATSPLKDRRTRIKLTKQYISHLQLQTGIPIENRADFDGELGVHIKCDQKLRKIDDDRWGLDLLFEVKAGKDQDVAYTLALVYSGLVLVEEKVEEKEKLLTALYVNTPSILYPFARSEIIHATRNAGFPALELEPLNFYSLYLKKRDRLLKEAL